MLRDVVPGLMPVCAPSAERCRRIAALLAGAVAGFNGFSISDGNISSAMGGINLRHPVAAQFAVKALDEPQEMTGHGRCQRLRSLRVSEFACTPPLFHVRSGV
jgi:hypothetical protein